MSTFEPPAGWTRRSVLGGLLTVPVAGLVNGCAPASTNEHGGSDESPLCTAAPQGAQDARKFLQSGCPDHRLAWTLRLSAHTNRSLSKRVPYLEPPSTLSQAVGTTSVVRPRAFLRISSAGYVTILLPVEATSESAWAHISPGARASVCLILPLRGR